MDLKQMNYFKTIVEQGTISKAAKVLHMAQPPLSMQLKQLEEELGVTLLNRGQRKIELTQSGQLFYKRCLQILELSDMTKNELQKTYHETLKIGITSSNVSLLKKAKDYFEENRHVHYMIKEGSTYEMMEMLYSHNIDLGVVRTPFDSSLVEALYLEKEPMVAIGKNDYFKDKKQSIRDFEDIPLIIHQRYLSLVQDYCLNQHISLFLKVTCDDSRTSKLLASTGLGVAIIPLSCLNDPGDMEFCYLDDQELYTGIALITRKNEKPSPSLQQFINALNKR